MWLRAGLVADGGGRDPEVGPWPVLYRRPITRFKLNKRQLNKLPQNKKMNFRLKSISRTSSEFLLNTKLH